MADQNQPISFTGDPDIDRNIAAGMQSFLQQNAAAAQASEQGQNPNPQPQSPQPWKVAVQGREYSFNSPQELSQALEATFTQFQNTLAAQQTQAAAPAAPAHADETPAFSTEKYIDTMKQDPIAAQEYLDSHRYFGGKVEKPSELIRSQLQQADQNARLLAVYQFKEAHPEYQGNQQAAQVIQQLREELRLPFDFNGLEAAYALARQRNLIPQPVTPYPGGQQPQQPPQFQQQPPQQPQFGQPTQQQPFIPNPPSPYGGQSPYGVDPRAFNGGAGFGQGNNPYLAPPPGLPGRGGFPGGAPDFASQAENLTPEQIQQIFAMAGQRGPGF